jgi:hypothetical protein
MKKYIMVEGKKYVAVKAAKKERVSSARKLSKSELDLLAGLTLTEGESPNYRKVAFKGNVGKTIVNVSLYVPK